MRNGGEGAGGRDGKDDKSETNVGKERVCTENKPLCIKRLHTDNIMMSAHDKCKEMCSKMKYSPFEK